MNSEDRLAARDELARRLRKEASNQSPQYSALRHERIMHRLSQESPAIPTEPHHVFRWRVLATAAAVLIAVLIPAALWRTRSPMPTIAIKSPGKLNSQTALSASVPPLPPFDTALASALKPASEQLDRGRFAYLDQDAQRLTHFVADQFDVWPPSRQ